MCFCSFDALAQPWCIRSTMVHPLNFNAPAQLQCTCSTSMHLLNFDAPVQFRCTFISSMHFTTMIAASNGRQVHRVLKSALNFEKCTEFHEVHQASRSASGLRKRAEDAAPDARTVTSRRPQRDARLRHASKVTDPVHIPSSQTCTTDFAAPNSAFCP